MKSIINIILKGLIIAGAAYLMPNYVMVGGVKELVIALLLMIAIGIVSGIALICFAAVGATFNFPKWLFIVMTFIFVFATEFLTLWIVSNFYSGFTINGWYTYVILVALFCLLPSNSNKKNK